MIVSFYKKLVSVRTLVFFFCFFSVLITTEKQEKDIKNTNDNNMELKNQNAQGTHRSQTLDGARKVAIEKRKKLEQQA